MLGVAIGSQFLLRNGGGSVNIPSFRRDFAGVKTLNHGIGPDITFTRTGTATYFDATGTLTTATADVARFDHDPSTGASRGLLIEETRINSIRNSQAGGSTNGVIGSGGVMPTNWSISANANGVTSEIIGTGTEGGLAYIDIKVSGTPTASGTVFINQEPNAQIVAANGQTWTASIYVKLASGAHSNVSTQLTLRASTAAGVQVVGQGATTTFTPTSSALNTQRIVVIPAAFNDATVERVTEFVRVNYTNGNAFDLTLRIAAPQLEQGSFATSYIPTTSAAVSRGADVAVVTPISSFVTQTGDESLFAEFSAYTYGATGSFPRIVQLDQGSTNTERYNTVIVQSASNVFVSYVVNNVSQFGLNSSPTYSLNSTAKTASGIAFNNARHAFNGVLTGADDTSITLRTNQNTHLQIGRDGVGSGSSYLNGHIRKIAYYPKRLSNETLKSLTA